MRAREKQSKRVARERERGWENGRERGRGSERERRVHTHTHARRVAIAGRSVLLATATTPPATTAPPAIGPFCAPTRQKIDGVPVGHYRAHAAAAVATTAPSNAAVLVYTYIYVCVYRPVAHHPHRAIAGAKMHEPFRTPYFISYTRREMCACAQPPPPLPPRESWIILSRQKKITHATRTVYNNIIILYVI